MSDAAKPAPPTVLSLAQLLEQQPSTAPAGLVEPGLLPPQGILFVGGEPKVGKSLLVANLALSLAAGVDRLGFSIPARRRVLICQFELPVPQFVSRLSLMRRALGAAADQHLLVDTRASGHLLSAAQGLNHFVAAARAAAAMPPAPLSSSCIMFENPSAVTRSAAPFAAPVLCMPWATVICCSRGLLRTSLPSSFVFSFAMRLRCLRGCFNSIPALCGSPRPRSRPPQRRRDAKLKRQMSPRLWQMWVTKFTTTNCATRS